MKKIVPILLFLVIAVPLFAATQTMFQMDHPVYDEMEVLYTMEGLASPLGTKPWSEKDVERMLEPVNPETEIGKSLKSRIQKYLTTPPPAGK